MIGAAQADKHKLVQDSLQTFTVGTQMGGAPGYSQCPFLEIFQQYLQWGLTLLHTLR